MYTDTVTVYLGVSFFEGACRQRYDIVWMGCPRRKPWIMLRTPVCFRILSSYLTSVSIFSVCCYSKVSISWWRMKKCILSVQIECGETGRENITYYLSSSTTTSATASPTSLSRPTVCEYTVCPASDNICRLRLDFNTFKIASPNTAVRAPSSGPSVVLEAAPKIGVCERDSFTGWENFLSLKQVPRRNNLQTDSSPDCITMRFATIGVSVLYFSEYSGRITSSSHLWDEQRSAHVYVDSSPDCISSITMTFATICVSLYILVYIPGGIPPPVICGMNSGQHMYVDSSPDCITMIFATIGVSMLNF